jgi:hypothetical protein
MIRRILTMLVTLAFVGEAASAAVSYNFEVEQPTYNVLPNATVAIPIYLKETLTGGSTSQIDADGGLFGFGITLDQTSGGGQITDLVRNPLFDLRAGASTTTFPADPARLWAHQNAVTVGVDPDVDGRILLATLTFQAPASGTTTFSIGDFQTPSDETVTYAAAALDGVITAGNFSVVAAIPEPSAALLVVAAPLATLARRRRVG